MRRTSGDRHAGNRRELRRQVRAALPGTESAFEDMKPRFFLGTEIPVLSKMDLECLSNNRCCNCQKWGQLWSREVKLGYDEQPLLLKYCDHCLSYFVLEDPDKVPYVHSFTKAKIWFKRGEVVDPCWAKIPGVDYE